MKSNSLCEEFRRFEGQPVKVYTDDGRVHCGIDMEAFDDAVRILDRCGRPILIEYRRIDAVVEPQMRIHHPCCKECRCDDDDRDRDRDRDRDDCDDEDYD